jgi:uncharacterized SAM-binding protein YcdF (DUF218 family)
MRRRRLLRLLLLALGAVAAALVALSFPLFVFPPTDDPGRADAVVVFAGGDGERQDEGVRLTREGLAPVLVISDGGLPGSRNARVCRQRPAGLRLICLTPRPATTRGEARAFADLAEREGWGSLALVTSTYHMRRASLLLDRCYRGRLHRVAVQLRNASSYQTGQQIATEWVGLVAALTVQRSC